MPESHIMNFINKTSEVLKRKDSTIGDFRRSIREWAQVLAGDRVQAMYSEARSLRIRAGAQSAGGNAGSSMNLNRQASQLEAQAREYNKMIGEWVNWNIDDDGWPSEIEKAGVRFALGVWGFYARYEYLIVLIGCLYGFGFNLETATDESNQRVPLYSLGLGQWLLYASFHRTNGRVLLKLTNETQMAHHCGEEWMIGDSHHEYSDKTAVKSGGYTFHLATDTGKIETVGLSETHVLMVVSDGGTGTGIQFIGEALRKYAIKIFVKELLVANLSGRCAEWHSKPAIMTTHTPTRQIPVKKWYRTISDVTDILRRSGWDLTDISDKLD
ncbi:hypothetical protein HDU76_013219 [Blyttiomyces sp. JEL0837]|nr:hypothetical protein HDU76_013219 [Blyttiomyces sp. JEL0837]